MLPDSILPRRAHEVIGEDIMAENEGAIAPRSRTRDEGRPLGAGLQEQASNYPKLLRSRAVVVSVGGKGTA